MTEVENDFMKLWIKVPIKYQLRLNIKISLNFKSRTATSPLRTLRVGNLAYFYDQRFSLFGIP